MEEPSHQPFFLIFSGQVFTVYILFRGCGFKVSNQSQFIYDNSDSPNDSNTKYETIGLKVHVKIVKLETF